MQIPDVNLESIPEQATRQLIGQLLNFIEALVAENATLHVENQQLRDELARLKGASPQAGDQAPSSACLDRPLLGSGAPATHPARQAQTGEEHDPDGDP